MVQIPNQRYFLPENTYQRLRHDFTHNSALYARGEVNRHSIVECCRNIGFNDETTPRSQTIRNFLSRDSEIEATSRKVLTVLCWCLYEREFQEWEASLPDHERPSLDPLRPSVSVRESDSDGDPNIAHGLEEVFLTPPHQQLLQDALESAQQEVWIFGNTLDVTLSVVPLDKFLEILGRGVTLRFLVFDCSDENDLRKLVEAGDGTRQDAINSCNATYSRLLDLMVRWYHDDHSEFEQSLLKVKLTPNPLKMRMVVVDLSNPSKRSYFIPSVNRSKTAGLPWFLCRNTPDGLINIYARRLAIEWEQSLWIQEFLRTEPGSEFLREYPDIVDSYPIEARESRPIV